MTVNSNTLAAPLENTFISGTADGLSIINRTIACRTSIVCLSRVQSSCKSSIPLHNNRFSCSNWIHNWCIFRTSIFQAKQSKIVLFTTHDLLLLVVLMLNETRLKPFCLKCITKKLIQYCVHEYFVLTAIKRTLSYLFNMVYWLVN